MLIVGAAAPSTLLRVQALGFLTVERLPCTDGNFDDRESFYYNVTP